MSKQIAKMARKRLEKGEKKISIPCGIKEKHVEKWGGFDSAREAMIDFAETNEPKTNEEVIIAVRAPKGNVNPWITSGKEYEIHSSRLDYNGNMYFSIIDDEGDAIACYLHKCRHLNGLDWEIVY